MVRTVPDEGDNLGVVIGTAMILEGVVDGKGSVVDISFNAFRTCLMLASTTSANFLDKYIDELMRVKARSGIGQG